MKKYINGAIVEMTPEEIAALESARQEAPASEPTPEERLTALESAMLAMMGGGLDV